MQLSGILSPKLQELEEDRRKIQTLELLILYSLNVMNKGDKKCTQNLFWKICIEKFTWDT